MTKYLYVLCGHTAAGKTTLGKKICESLDMELVSEGKIKREMVEGTYSAENSLDESLRDKGYLKAIEVCLDKLKEKDSILLDASFHKKFRREWLRQAVLNSNMDVVMIWLFVHCPNKDKVILRINQRKVAKKEADNQADSIAIYEHIISTFDPLTEEELLDNSILYSLNTDIEEVDKKYIKNLKVDINNLQLNKTQEFVDSYFVKK